MENNILEALGNLLNKNNQYQPQNSQPNNTPPLYPVEAFSSGDKTQEGPQQQNNMGGNNLLPLLLSMMSGKGDGNFDMLSNLLSTQNGGQNSEAGNLLSIFSSLNKKKKEDNKKEVSEETPVITQGNMPKDELL